MACDRKIGPFDCCSVVQGDCLELMHCVNSMAVEAIVSDPPYPDYHVGKYQYRVGDVEYLDRFRCQQFVFWSAKADFPLSHSAVHIWDKKTGCGSQYERIFERHGGKEYRVFRHYFINSTVAASFTGDVFTGHPSQKPVALMEEIIKCTDAAVILDPYCGSGSTLVSAKKLGRHFLGFEISEAYCQISRERLARIDAQPSLFEKKPEQLSL